MKQRNIWKSRRLMLAAWVGIAMAAPMALADGLPDMGAVDSSTPWRADVYYQNHTAYRGKDATGETVGLSKFRNTIQVEADKGINDGWAIHSVLRGTYDGVYDMNRKEFGNDAGGAINMQSTTPGGYLSTPWGTGPVTHTVVSGLGLVGNTFVDTYPASNSNSGLRVLGDGWHGINGGVAFGVPVRPCNVDSRGCADFGGYGNRTKTELASPEFNSRLDFIRELYAKKLFKLGGGTDLFVKVGKQQVIWGRTDLFRVLDVINPVDYSRNNIYDELQDIRIPMWIAQAEWRFGGGDILQERNLQVVWNFDQFRANNLGQCGTPNSILDAGCFFRGMKNLWDNGGTVSNFANVGPNTLLATNFGPHQIGINNVNLPGWSFNNTQLGVKFEGVTSSGLNFSLNALTYRSQLPSLHGGQGAVNSFTGVSQSSWPYLIAFNMEFPRVNLVGGSLDFQIPDAAVAVRMEGAYTTGEEFPNTARPNLYSRNHVFRSVIGIDRPTFVPFISETRTTLFSGQLFYQHIFDHELFSSVYGPVGMPDWKDNFIGTLLIKAFLVGDRVSPQLIMARDFRAQAYAVAPSVDWSITDNLRLTFGANRKYGDPNRNQFDDCRSCNPFPPFTAPNGDPNPFVAGSRGLGGVEPLGRFRAGPIGAAFDQNDIYFQVNYKF